MGTGANIIDFAARFLGVERKSVPPQAAPQYAPPKSQNRDQDILDKAVGELSGALFIYRNYRDATEGQNQDEAFERYEQRLTPGQEDPGRILDAVISYAAAAGLKGVTDNRREDVVRSFKIFGFEPKFQDRNPNFDAMSSAEYATVVIGHVVAQMQRDVIPTPEALRNVKGTYDNKRARENPSNSEKQKTVDDMVDQLLVGNIAKDPVQLTGWIADYVNAVQQAPGRTLDTGKDRIIAALTVAGYEPGYKIEKNLDKMNPAELASVAAARLIENLRTDNLNEVWNGAMYAKAAALAVVAVNATQNPGAAPRLVDPALAWQAAARGGQGGNG